MPVRAYQAATHADAMRVTKHHDTILDDKPFVTHITCRQHTFTAWIHVPNYAEHQRVIDTATCNYAPSRRESMHWLSLFRIAAKLTDGVDGFTRNLNDSDTS